MIWLLLVLAYIAVDALVQARITRLFRHYVPPIEQAGINFTLHYLAPLLFVLVSVALWRGWWPGYVVSVLLRLALFDVVLNLAKSDPLFSVGYSAQTDKLLRRLWPAHPERLSAALRLGALVLGLGFWYWCRK